MRRNAVAVDGLHGPDDLGGSVGRLGVWGKRGQSLGQSLFLWISVTSDQPADALSFHQVDHAEIAEKGHGQRGGRTQGRGQVE